MSITIYTTRYCPFCVRAKNLLDAKRVDYDEISVDGNNTLRQQMAQKAGRNTVPQIWIGQEHIGGCDELFYLERQGKLDARLSALLP